jgi:maltooligosyltrehalose trehalohydrolase
MDNEYRLGAWPLSDGTQFAVWSDKASKVTIRWQDGKSQRSGELELARASTQAPIFSALLPGAGAGTTYEVLVDGRRCVDPYARSLPNGVHGAAEVAELPRKPTQKRQIVLERGEVFYELHVGTFTAEGTFAAASRRFPELAALGVTVLELMPIAAFAGKRGWGYDGVALLAPFAPYGTLTELTELLETAHALGLSVVLDVVYNHLGPDGNYLPAFSESYFDSGRNNPWGKAPAFAQPAFRRLVTESARYWLEDVGFDGLRIDAAHELEPGGEPHILQELSAVARACTPPAVLTAEDDRNNPGALFELGIDAVWSDDLHHCIHVLLTSEHDGYYAGYRGDLEELARVIERGQLYEGQVFPPSGRPRGTPSAHVPRHRLIYALQNHDQVGNRAHGERLLTLSSPAQFDIMLLLLLFLPGTPLLFMGQEVGADSPFLYFSDHAGELGEAVTKGRREEFGSFEAFRSAESSDVPDPQAEETFLRSKLRYGGEDAKRSLEFHRRALMLRREDAALHGQREVQAGVEGTVLWVITRNHAGRRLLLLNIGGLTAVSSSGPERDLAGARVLLATAAVLHEGSPLMMPAESCAVFELSRDA